MLQYLGEDLSITGSDFQTNRDDRKSISGSIFTLGREAIVWRSIKQNCVANTKETEQVAALEEYMEAIWLQKFLADLEVVIARKKPINFQCDKRRTIANIKVLRHHKRAKHIDQ